MARLDLSMSATELETFLSSARTVRLATCGTRSGPHVVPLWYVWLDGTMFMNSTLGNVTLRNVEENPMASALVDDGDTYDVLRGAILQGPVQRADADPQVERVGGLWSHKYLGGAAVPYGRWKNRVWLRLVPESIASWDFRKIAAAKARARGG
jgi:hypothetical protein